MATYKVTYLLEGEHKVEYVNDVFDRNGAIEVADYRNPLIPQDVRVEVELISE